MENTSHTKTINEQEFATICSAAWVEAVNTLRRSAVRKKSPADVVRSAIYRQFEIESDPPDRRNVKVKLEEVMVDRMRPPFDYKLIVNKYTMKAERQYGSEAPVPTLSRSPHPKKPTGRGGKADFLRKRI